MAEALLNAGPSGARHAMDSTSCRVRLDALWRLVEQCRGKEAEVLRLLPGSEQPADGLLGGRVPAPAGPGQGGRWLGRRGARAPGHAAAHPGGARAGVGRPRTARGLADPARAGRRPGPRLAARLGGAVGARGEAGVPGRAASHRRGRRSCAHRHRPRAPARLGGGGRRMAVAAAVCRRHRAGGRRTPGRGRSHLQASLPEPEPEPGRGAETLLAGTADAPDMPEIPKTPGRPPGSPNSAAPADRADPVALVAPFGPPDARTVRDLLAADPEAWRHCRASADVLSCLVGLLSRRAPVARGGVPRLRTEPAPGLSGTGAWHPSWSCSWTSLPGRCSTNPWAQEGESIVLEALLQVPHEAGRREPCAGASPPGTRNGGAGRPPRSGSVPSTHTRLFRARSRPQRPPARRPPGAGEPGRAGRPGTAPRHRPRDRNGSPPLLRRPGSAAFPARSASSRPSGCAAAPPTGRNGRSSARPGRPCCCAVSSSTTRRCPRSGDDRCPPPGGGRPRRSPEVPARPVAGRRVAAAHLEDQWWRVVIFPLSFGI
ncbi:hypothetical protein SHIRM173S_06402 [Streptomyces hirsutus]